MGTRLRDLLHHRATGRGRAVLLAALVLGLAPAASALADTLTMSVTPAQPTDAGDVRITAQGTAAGDLLYVHYEQASAGDCAANPAADTSGAAVSPNLTTVGPGLFTAQGAPEPYPLGSYLLCGWLTDPNNAMTVLAPIAQLPFTVTAADTLSLADPADAIAGQPFDVTASGTSYDAAATLDATYKPAGGSCASTPGADTGTPTDVGGTHVNSGPYSDTPFAQQTLNAGNYLFCAWLVDTMYPAPLAATSEVVVVNPPQASLQLVAPAQVDGGENFTVALHANVSAGVPLIAVAALQPATGSRACAASPAGEPTTAVTELDTPFTGSQLPTGTVTETDAHATAPSFGTYVLCAWLLANWTGQPIAPTVAGPVSTTVTALPAETYRGHTSQRLPITITVAPVERLLLDLDYADRLHCRGRATLRSGERWNGIYSNQLNPGTFGTLRLGSDGKFRTNLNGNRNHTLRIAGVLSGKMIRGTFTEQGDAFVFTGNTRQRSACSTGTVSYTVATR